MRESISRRSVLVGGGTAMISPSFAIPLSASTLQPLTSAGQLTNRVTEFLAHLDESNVEKAGGLDVSGLNSQLRNATLGRAKWETAH